MTATAWLTALLGGALPRRRRQTTLGLVAVASLFTAQAGCGPEASMTEATGSGTSDSSTALAMSTGDGPGEVSARMFNKFHSQYDEVGKTILDDSPDEMVWYPWSTLRIDGDGTLTLSLNFCQSFDTLQKFSWVHLGGDVLQVVPDAYRSDGTFLWHADYVTAVTLAPGRRCDDIEAVSEHLPDSGESTYTIHWAPGEVCADGDSPGSGDDCNFTFVWCDGAAPPACTAEAP